MRENAGLAGARPSITILILMIAALAERRLSTQRGLRGFPRSPQALVLSFNFSYYCWHDKV
jgi:hypothetical protein